MEHGKRALADVLDVLGSQMKCSRRAVVASLLLLIAVPARAFWHGAAPLQNYTAEDGVTNYTAEDGTTVYTTE